MIGQFELNWPTQVTTMFEYLGAPAEATDALYSIDCLLHDFGIPDDNTKIIIELLIIAF